MKQWAMQGSNLRPHPCKGCALANASRSHAMTYVRRRFSRCQLGVSCCGAQVQSVRAGIRDGTRVAMFSFACLPMSAKLELAPNGFSGGNGYSWEVTHHEAIGRTRLPPSRTNAQRVTARREPRPPVPCPGETSQSSRFRPKNRLVLVAGASVITSIDQEPCTNSVVGKKKREFAILVHARLHRDRPRRPATHLPR